MTKTTSLSSIARGSEEEANDVGSDGFVPGVDPDVAPLVLPLLHGYQHQVQFDVADLGHFLTIVIIIMIRNNSISIDLPGKSY